MAGLEQFRAVDARATAELHGAAIGQAFSRALDREFQFAVGGVTEGGAVDLSARVGGPGLVWVFQIGPTTALGILPESSGIVPGWCERPDADGRSKLQTLASELRRMLFPEDLVPSDCLVTRVRDLATVMEQAELAPDCSSLTVSLASATGTGEFTLVWPAARADCLTGPEPASASAESGPREGNDAAAEGERVPIRYRDLEEGLRHLPPYARSLLKIPVPVTVTLAESKQPLRAILDIGPGSIIHFSKSCEDTLTLEVGGHKFAVGETVKVGDKFGLWITSIILPDERFWVIRGHRPAVRAK